MRAWQEAGGDRIAHSGGSAPSRAHRSPPAHDDVGTVDIGLPDGDGFELARNLTALPWQPRVVVTSLESDSGLADQVRRSGANAFIHKADLPGAPVADWLGAA